MVYNIYIMNTTKLPTVKELLRDSYHFFGENYKKLIKIYLFYIALFFVAAASAAIFFLVASILIHDAIAIGLSFLWFFLISLSISAFIFQLSIALYKNNLKSLSDELADYYKKIKSATWLMALYTLVIQGGYFLLFLPGVFLSTSIRFSPYFFFERDKRGTSALAYSYELVKGNWWEIFWRVLIVLLALIIPMIVVIAILGIIASVIFTVAQIPFWILMLIIIPILIAYVFMTSVMFLRIEYKLYKALEAIKGEFVVTEKRLKNSKIIFIILFIIGIFSYAFDSLKEDKKDDKSDYKKSYMMNDKFMDGMRNGR